MIDKIISIVCIECVILEDDFFKKTPRCDYDLSKALSMCAYVLFDMGYRHADIAKMIKRKRSMIYYYLSRHLSLLFADRLYRETFEKITEKLKENSII